MIAALFAIVVLAWSFTWYAIHLQLGAVPTEVSIFWRFCLATIVLTVWLALSGRLRRAELRQHIWFAGLGLTLFSVNFGCFYAAERYVPSGIVSVVFSIAAGFNVFNQWLFLRVRPAARVLLGACVGSIGVGCLFADQLAQAGGGYDAALGLVLALGGTYLFSLGNLISRRATQHGTDLPNAVARGMGWGAALLAASALLRGQSLVPATSASYLGALLYLALIGSVLGFLAYLSLVRRVGPERAAYVTILSPVIALALSVMLEGCGWNRLALAGLPLILLGNLVIFMPGSRLRLLWHRCSETAPDCLACQRRLLAAGD